MCFQVQADLQHAEVKIDTRDSGNDPISLLLSVVEQGLSQWCKNLKRKNKNQLTQAADVSVYDSDGSDQAHNTQLSISQNHRVHTGVISRLLDVEVCTIHVFLYMWVTPHDL